MSAFEDSVRARLAAMSRDGLSADDEKLLSLPEFYPVCCLMLSSIVCGESVKLHLIPALLCIFDQIPVEQRSEQFVWDVEGGESRVMNCTEAREYYRSLAGGQA